MTYEIQKINTDFVVASNGVDLASLQDSIWTDVLITTIFHGCRTENNGEDIYFVFEAAPSVEELTQLDVLIAAHVGKPAPLTALQVEIQAAKVSIDDCAGAARARYITVTPGQTAVYIEKEKQAKEFQDAGYPVDETGYEFITAEKNAQSVSATVAANTILGMAAGWKFLAANIEEIRLDYKNQVSAAPSITSVSALKNKARAILNAI